MSYPIPTCPTCGPSSDIVEDSDNSYWSGTVRVYCRNCFDAEYVGDPAVATSRNVFGEGKTLELANRDFDEQWADRQDTDSFHGDNCSCLECAERQVA